MEKKGTITVQFILNDDEIKADVAPEMSLMRYLRDEMDLKGTKNGCETGHCGTCSVIIDGKVRRACLVKMKRVDGVHVETIENLSKDGTLHPLQQAFIETGAVQCGFCTPGMIMAGKALLDKNPNPDLSEIKSALTVNRNLCRCTGYVSILDAVQLAARRISHGAEGGIEEAAQAILINPQLKDEYIKKVTGSCHGSNPKKMIEDWHSDIMAQKKDPAIMSFHNIEFITILAICLYFISSLSIILYPITLGVFVHFICDKVWDFATKEHEKKRYWSIILWLISKIKKSGGPAGV